MKSISIFSLIAISSLFLGCASQSPSVQYVDPNAQGKVAGTGIESQDINAAGLQAAQSIINLPQIANAEKPPVVLIEPVTNKSSSPIDASLYTSVLRDALLNNSGGKVRFLDRDYSDTNKKEQAMIQSGEVTGSNGNRSALTYDYILTAELQGIGMSNSQGQSDYFRLAFKLVDRKTDLLLWTNAYQIKKEGKESAVYR